MLQQLFNWSEANIGLLEKMAASGMSASQAAAELRCSRNAVIGKAHRLGISFGHSRGAPTKPKAQGAQTQSTKTPWTQERLENASKLWRAGTPTETIAKATGCSIAALHYQAGQHRDLFPKRGYQQPEKVTRPDGDGTKYVFNADSVPFLLPDFPGVRFIDLESHHCKFPVSNDHGAEMLVCGAPRLHGSYCGVHAMVARGRGTESERKATSVGRAW